MADQLLEDAMALFVELRRLRLDLVVWINRRLGEAGINLPQYTLMEKLDEMGQTTMGVIADRLGVTMGAATNLVDRLVHAGHVTRKRSETDRRVVQVKLTDAGRELLYRVTDATAEFLTEFLAGASPDDRQTTVRVVRALAEGVASFAQDDRKRGGEQDQ